MATFEVTQSGLSATLDLHGYKLNTVLRVTNKKIREAWDNGCEELLIIHGGGWSKRSIEFNPQTRGAIGGKLRELYHDGKWGVWVVNADIRINGMTVYLLRNPTPVRPIRWARLPELEFNRKGAKSMQAYCSKCRSHREIRNPQKVTQKNGSPAIRGKCPVCGTSLLTRPKKKPQIRTLPGSFEMGKRR